MAEPRCDTCKHSTEEAPASDCVVVIPRGTHLGGLFCAVEPEWRETKPNHFCSRYKKGNKK